MVQFSPILFFLIAGIALIAVELIIFQASVFWFLFVGLGAIFASLASFIVSSESWFFAVSVFIVATVIFSIALYRPIKNWSNKSSPIAGNDAIGQAVKVKKSITQDEAGVVIWSGTDWSANLASGQNEPIEAGETAYIVSMEGIRLSVKK